MRVDKSKWHRDLLGNLCNIKRGGSPRPIQKFLTDAPDGINWIKIGDAGDSKFISSCKEKIIPEGVSKSRFVHKGDFLLSNSMSFGRPYILNVDGCIHDGWLVLEQPKQFDKSYLYYLLGSAPMYEKFAQKAQGAVVNNLNIDRVASVEIIYPPLDIQQAIAAELDAAQAMIDGYKAQIADLDALAQSIFLDMFGDPVTNPKGWKKEPINKVTSSNASKQPVVATNGKVWALNLDKIESNSGEILSLDMVEETEIGPSTYPFDSNMILYSKLRPYLNKVVAPIKSGYATTELVPFTPLSTLNKIYFLYLLRNKSTVRILNASSGGARMPRTKMDFMRNLPIPIPPLALQQHFATQVETIEKQKELLRQQLADAETLMAERMQYYFS